MTLKDFGSSKTVRSPFDGGGEETSSTCSSSSLISVGSDWSSSMAACRAFWAACWAAGGIAVLVDITDCGSFSRLCVRLFRRRWRANSSYTRRAERIHSSSSHRPLRPGRCWFGVLSSPDLFIAWLNILVDPDLAYDGRPSEASLVCKTRSCIGWGHCDGVDKSVCIIRVPLCS